MSLTKRRHQKIYVPVRAVIFEIKKKITKNFKLHIHIYAHIHVDINDLDEFDINLKTYLSILESLV